MRITLNLSDRLVAELIELSGIINKTKAIELAVLSFIKKLKREKIKSFCGKIHLDVDIAVLRKGKIKAKT